MTTTDKAAEREELRKMLPKNISRPLSYEDKIRFSCFSEREMLDFAQQVLERERERCAAICEAMRPISGRAWSPEQLACYSALSDAATAIRSGQYLPEPVEGA